MDGDSCKSALFQLHILFYITQIVLMAILAPVASLLAWLPSCLDLHILGQFCQSFSWWLVFSTFLSPAKSIWISSCRHGDYLVVIISWWFRFGDFEINKHYWSFLEKALLVLSIFSYGTLLLHATCILFLSFLTVISFLTVTSLSTMALGPLLDASDRCVGCFSLKLLRGRLHRAPGNCCFSPTMCYYSLW